MNECPTELTLNDFIKWLRDHSHKVGYSRLLYLYNDDGKEAKRLLNWLMFLDCTSEWGWMDNYIEYCPARCFAPRAETYRKIIEGGAHRKLEPIDPRTVKHSDNFSFVTLALTDVQELADDNRSLRNVLDISRRLATRTAFIMFTGNGYPSDVFTDQPEMARFLLDGLVVKVDGDTLSFTSGRSARNVEMPFWGLLSCGYDNETDRSSEWSIRECKHLVFQWELLCTWKDRYKAFDLDLFKDAFVGAWKLLQTKSSSEDYRYRWRLIAMMSGFFGGLLRWYLPLMTDFGPLGDGVIYGDPCEMAAAQLLVDSFLKKALKENLSRMDKTLKLSKVIRHDEYDYWKPTKWKRDLTLSNFSEAIDDLALTIHEVHTSAPCAKREGCS